MHLLRIFLIASLLPICACAQTPSLDDLLKAGKLDDALDAYRNPKTDEERLALSLAQALDAARTLSRGFVGLGIDPEVAQSIPFFRMTGVGAAVVTTVPTTPDRVAGIFRDFQKALRIANATARTVTSAEGVQVTLNLSEARVDFDGDGAASETERIDVAFGRILGIRPPGSSEGTPPEPLVVDFDAADAAWLTGYTELLDGVVSLLSAYDWMPVWNQFAHVLFKNPEPMPPFARVEVSRARGSFGFLPDAVAAIHEMRLPLIDRSKPAAARDSFLAMIASSRTCWKRALEESDQGREWLPSPSQTGPRGTKVSQEQVDRWLEVLDELEAVTTGKKLLPHWRTQPGNGINVPRMIDNPPPFDLVMWAHGAALLPYVEKGDVSDAQTWNRLRQPFGPGFVRFALWSN